MLGDLVIVASDGSEDGKLGYVYAFERATGKVRWKHIAGPGAVSGIVGQGRAVYTVTMQGALLCLDRDSGLARWIFPLEPWGWTGPATVDDLVVAAGRDGRVQALRPRDGKVLWERGLNAAVTTSPAIEGGDVYLGTDDGQVHRLDRRTGAERNVLGIPGRYRGRPVVTADRVLLMLADEEENVRVVVGLDRALKAEVWRQTAARHWSTSRLFLWKEMVVVAGRGQVDAFAARDGRRTWTRTLEGTVRVVGGADDALYAATTDGIVTAFAPP